MQLHSHNKFMHEACICAWCYVKCLIYATFPGWMFISVSKFNIKHESNRARQMFAPPWTNLLWCIFELFLSFSLLNLQAGSNEWAPQGGCVTTSTRDSLNEYFLLLQMSTSHWTSSWVLLKWVLVFDWVQSISHSCVTNYKNWNFIVILLLHH